MIHFQLPVTNPQNSTQAVVVFLPAFPDTALPRIWQPGGFEP